MAERAKIADVEVVDWSKAGDMYLEDGLYKLPAAEWVVVATTKRGERYLYSLKTWDIARNNAARDFAGKVGRRGYIDLEHWTFWRNEYGSAAWGDEEMDRVIRNLEEDGGY